MKEEMTSFDIFAIVQELQYLLKGARINKIFQTTPQELKIHLNTKEHGKAELVIETGKRIHLTESPRPSPTVPSTFAMTLRKYLNGGIIEEIRQVGFDRIAEIKVGGKESCTLIAELFGKGNVILTDSKGVIKAVMKPQRYRARSLIGKEVYEYPPSKLNPFSLSLEELKDAINASELNLVKSLATSLGLGGFYAEEICLRTGIAKDKVSIDDSEAKEIFDVLIDLRKNVSKKGGCIVLDDEEFFDVTPVKLRIYQEKEVKEFGSFNNALDEYFSSREVEKVEGIIDKKYREKLEKIEKRLREQEETLAKFVKVERDSKGTGDLIYAHYDSIEGILDAITKAKKRYSPDKILEMIKESKLKEARMIKKLLFKEGAILLEIEGMEIRLDLRKNAAKNADFYYTKSKKMRRKIEGTKLAIEKTEKELEDIKAKGKRAIEIKEKMPVKRVVKERKWFEKFRWFVSSDGFLVIGGKDATSNEVLVKRHMENNDIFVHADIHGAPAVLIKTEGKEVPEKTIQEAFDFASTYSRAWKNNISSIDVYWVTPEQVSKRAEHGEYVAKGGFIIRGKRNWGKGEVRDTIGINEKFEIIGGPLSAVEKHSKYHVIIAPGRKKSKETAGEIRKRFLEMAKKEDEEKIRKIELEDIQEFLPSGESDIVKG